jgi:hypothetical protein
MAKFIARNDDTKEFCCEDGHVSQTHARAHVGATRTMHRRVPRWSVWRVEGGTRKLTDTSRSVSERAAREVKEIYANLS